MHSVLLVLTLLITAVGAVLPAVMVGAARITQPRRRVASTHFDLAPSDCCPAFLTTALLTPDPSPESTRDTGEGWEGYAMTTTRYSPIVSPSVPLTPRLRMAPSGAGRSLLDGAWWPRSTDPIAELPALILSIGRLRGPVTWLILGADGWDTHPRHLRMAGRVLRLAYFASQPANLLTAICANGDRADLLVVPTHTADDTADAAMILAATTDNLVQAQHIVAAVSTPPTTQNATEREGGHPIGVLASAQQAVR